ncbi:MAG: acyltransferase, partial [Methanomicrobium sp.]|nr:acyltransferase [Methanomicrobium sp.]
MEKTEEWLWQCSIPDNAELQEHILKTESTVIIGEKSRIDYGLQGSEIIVSEFCQINGNIHADDDLR